MADDPETVKRKLIEAELAKLAPTREAFDELRQFTSDPLSYVSGVLTDRGGRADKALRKAAQEEAIKVVVIGLLVYHYAFRND